VTDANQGPTAQGGTECVQARLLPLKVRINVLTWISRICHIRAERSQHCCPRKIPLETIAGEWESPPFRSTKCYR